MNQFLSPFRAISLVVSFMIFTSAMSNVVLYPASTICGIDTKLLFNLGSTNDVGD